jgi:16S rRNA (guanine527-N7)-methyltransferase
MIELLQAGLTQLGLDPSAAPRLAQYGQLLVEKNQVMNLTAITDPVGVAQKHMLDCAALLGSAEFNGRSLIDVGTGAGFPGLVLKICMGEQLDLTLLDSLGKRVSWLEEISQTLNAPARCIHARAEELAMQPEYREQFDIATARAVADLRMLCELCLPYVKVGGVFLAMKAEDCQPEIDAASRCITLLGGRLLPTYRYTVPGTDLVRRVVRIEKIAPTPERYPRRFAKIQKNPL